MPASTEGGQLLPHDEKWSLLEFVADLQTGARHAVVRPVAEIGMRGVCDLGHDVPVGVETIAGAQIFVEEDATAEFRAVIIALEIAGMNDAAEAGLGKSFSLKSTVQ